MELAHVEGARTRPGGLFGFGGRGLFGVEVVAAVGDQAGQGEEHGHEDARHGQDRPVLGTLPACLPAGPHPMETGGVMTLSFMTLPVIDDCRAVRVDVGRATWRVRVLAPGTPGTDTSARLVTQVTVTDTHPPATKFDVSTLIWGAVQVSPAPARDPSAAEMAWVSASEGSDWTTAAWTPARAADSTSPWAESIRPRATMRTMTIKRTGATITSSAMAEPSSPRARRWRQPLGRYSWMGASLVADTVRSNQGMSAWARPVTVTWATSPDSVVVETCASVSVPGPVVCDELVGGLGARVRRRAVARRHLAALFGRGTGQVAGVGPQGELDADDDQEEEDGEADHELREPFFSSTLCAPVSVAGAAGRFGSRSLDVVGRIGELGGDDADDDDGGGHDEGGDDDPRGDLTAFVGRDELVRADT